MAHAWRKFHELHVNHQSSVGEQVLKFFGQLYEVERKFAQVDSEARLGARKQRPRPVADALHQWLPQQRQRVPDGSVTSTGHRLEPESLGGAYPLPGRRESSDRQQLG